MSTPSPRDDVDGTSPLSSHTPTASFVDDAAVAGDLFDLAAPPLQQPLVARLVPVYAGLPTLDLHQDSGTIIVGRSKELSEDYRIDGCDKLSAKHCEFIVDPVTLRLVLRDLSTNGTFVNGTRVAKQADVELHNGDRVALTRPTPESAPSSSDVASANIIMANGRAEFIFQRVKKETTKADMLEELTCSICRAVFHRPCSVLPCMHVFCAGCISKWMQQGARCSCPECREAITDVRPTHRLQSCAEHFLLSSPESRRVAEDIEQLNAADTIPPTGLKVGKRSRVRGSDEDNEDGDGDDIDDDEEGEEDEGAAMLPLLNSSLRFMNRVPLAASRCVECDTASAIDGFRCPDGGPHLRCTACALPFAERPLCGRPQRCHVCNAAFCHLYRDGGCNADSVMPFKPFGQHTPLDVLPPTTFGGNTIEQSILSTYLAAKGILVKDAWAATLRKFESGEWVPDMVLINGVVRVDSPVCQRCAARVFAELLFHYRRSIAPDELPESVTDRSNCWYGKECRTQFHKLQHAQNFNHVCYQERRKE